MSIRYYTHAADKNHTKAQLRLSTILLTYTPYQNPALASTYLTKAATNGKNPDAQNMLGELIELGLGSESDSPNHTLAARWYRRAMRRGHARATYNLAALYEAGLGVGRDLERALRLYFEVKDVSFCLFGCIICEKF